MTKIMISYRRDDSMDITGRIFDRLTSRYGRESVFRDIDSIPPGQDFRDHLQAGLDGSDVLMVVVGPRWMGVDRQGNPRIHSETDYVRTEVEIALNRNIPVIPLLVGGSEMPGPSELPDTIKHFAFRNAVEVSSGRDFDHHMNGLIRATDRLLHGPPPGHLVKGEPAPAPETVATPVVQTPVPAPAAAAASEAGGIPILQILGGAILAQGIVHALWFTLGIISAIKTDTLDQSLFSMWSYADMVYGFGGIAVGMGTVYGRPWGRFTGIILSLLITFGNILWFIEHFDKGTPRLINAATALGLMLGVVATYLYIFHWPAQERR